MIVEECERRDRPLKTSSREAPTRRQDRLIREKVHDTYRLSGKLKEPTVCPRCEAVFHLGRWQWSERPKDAREGLCPACCRVRDHYPAGFVTLGGPFFEGNREEILNLVRNEGEKEQAERTLKRIMAIEGCDDRVLVTTTDSHLARRIGEALRRAYQGELDYAYNKEDDSLRVAWKR